MLGLGSLCNGQGASSPISRWPDPSTASAYCRCIAHRADRDLYEIFSAELERTTTAGLVPVLFELETVDLAAMLGIVTVELWRPEGDGALGSPCAIVTEASGLGLVKPVIRLLAGQRVGVVLEPVTSAIRAARLHTRPFGLPSVAEPSAAGEPAEEENPEPPARDRSDSGRRHPLRRRVRLSCRAALIGAVTVAGSVGAVADQPPSRRQLAQETPVPTAPSTATTRVVGPTGSGQPVTIAFAGDIHFEGVLARRLSAAPEALLATAMPTLASADLTVVNLETAVTERGTAQPKRFVFRAPAAAFGALAAAGIDVVNLANNHGMDFGAVGLQDTLAAARSKGVAVVGMGDNATEAYAPFRTILKGQRIAVLGATQVLDHHLAPSWTATEVQAGLASAKNVERLVDEVARTRASVDTLVVFLHWGVERQRCPTSAQAALARRLVAAGADIVVGSHAHRLQGAGRMGDAFVAYGLGNFAFYARGGLGAESGVLTVRATARRIDGYSWEPMVIAGGVPRGVTPGQSARMRRAWEDLRSCAGLQP